MKVPAKVGFASGRDIDLYAAAYGDGWENTIGAWSGELVEYNPDIDRLFKERYPLIKDLPTVPNMGMGTFDKEKMINLKGHVDAVMLPASYAMYFSWTPETWKDITDNGIAVLYFDMYTDPLRDVKKNTDALALLTQKQERVQGIYDYFANQVDIIDKAMKKVPDSKKGKTVYMELVGIDLNVYSGAPAMGTPELTYLGLKNIAEEKVKADNSKAGQVMYSKEELQKVNPDIIGFGFSQFGSPVHASLFGYNKNTTDAQLDAISKEILKRQGFSELKAVKEKSGYLYFPEMRFSYAAFGVVQFIGTIAYPEEFAGVDYMKNVQDFYDLYLPMYKSCVWAYDMFPA